MIYALAVLPSSSGAKRRKPPNTRVPEMPSSAASSTGVYVFAITSYSGAAKSRVR